MFKRCTLVILVLGILLVGCGKATPPTPIVVLESVEPTTNSNQIENTTAPTDTVVIPTDVVATPAVATDTPVVQPPTVAPVPETNVLPPSGDISVSAGNILVYPVPQLYTGDRVTFQLVADVPANLNPADIPVRIYVNDELIVDAPLGGRSRFSGDAYGLYEWVWTATDAGEHAVTVVLDPLDEIQVGDTHQDNNIVNLSINVLQAESAPKPWVTESTAYANIHVVQDTAAHRDIPLLKVEVDRAVQESAARLGIIPTEKLNIYFIDRVIGQGGYASNSMVISYPDRNYAGGGLSEVLRHEAVHVLDNQIVTGQGYRFMVEGIAVWATGGHYKSENLDQRAAALLLDTNSYLSLTDLVNNFYPAQHEIGYLEAGAFFGYLVHAYGLDTVRNFYANLSPRADQALAESLSHSMTLHFGKTLVQLEADWHSYLRAQPRNATDASDLLLTVDYYDLVRRYQQAYDPSAYFRSAWLPYPENLRTQGLTADLTRHPRAETNIVFETMLESADKALRMGDYDRVRALLNSVERALANNGRFLDPLSSSYQQIVRFTAGQGLEAQDITITTDGVQTATVLANSADNPELQTLTLALNGQQWQVTD